MLKKVEKVQKGSDPISFFIVDSLTAATYGFACRRQDTPSAYFFTQLGFHNMNVQIIDKVA